MTALGVKVSPEPKPKRKTGGKKKQGGGAVGSVAGWQPNQRQEFRGNAYEATCRPPSPPVVSEPMPARSGRSGSRVSSRGELYQYYKRMGMLEVFFSLFPDP
jgi:hypothetical protein